MIAATTNTECQSPVTTIKTLESGPQTKPCLSRVEQAALVVANLCVDGGAGRGEGLRSRPRRRKPARQQHDSTGRAESHLSAQMPTRLQGEKAMNMASSRPISGTPSRGTAA